MNEEKFRNEVAQLVAQGGYSSIRDLVDLVTLSKLKREYDFLIEEEDE